MGVVETVSLVSTIEVDGKPLMEWEDRSDISNFFAPYASAFECDGESVSLLITKATLDTLVHDIEDFLSGHLHDSSPGLDTYQDGQLRYVEAPA